MFGLLIVVNQINKQKKGNITINIKIRYYQRLIRKNGQNISENIVHHGGRLLMLNREHIIKKKRDYRLSASSSFIEFNIGLAVCVLISKILSSDLSEFIEKLIPLFALSIAE